MSSRLKNELRATTAVIYCRVSGSKQVSEGHGLQSQESRCREYAKARGYRVVEVFHEEGVSGSKLERPALMAMLAFLKLNADPNGMAVLIDDINRFARDTVVHWQLRAMIAEAGGKLESPSIEFGEDSDSKLIENLLASVSQHQREKNAEQVINRMKQRAKAGYWLFNPPAGYRYENVAGHGKLLVRDEPLATTIQEAFEAFASGRLETPAEVKRFLESRPEFPKYSGSEEIHFQRIHRLLTKPIYGGAMEVKKWGIPLMKAKHEGLVSFGTWETVQRRLNSDAKAPARPDISEDFVLRGFVLCGDCEHPMTASWSRSKSGKRHPYYHCHHKGCPSCRKSIRRADLEEAFTDLLKSMTPAPAVVSIAKAMFKDAWEQRAAQADQTARLLRTKIADAEKQIGALLDKLIEASSPRVISAYEGRIEALEREKLVAAEKLENVGAPAHPFGEMFEHALEFLANPYDIWKKGNLTMRRTVLRLAFADRLAYTRNQGVRTPEYALPFKALAGISGGGKQMVGDAVFCEPVSAVDSPDIA